MGRVEGGEEEEERSICFSFTCSHVRKRLSWENRDFFSFHARSEEIEGRM